MTFVIRVYHKIFFSLPKNLQLLNEPDEGFPGICVAKSKHFFNFDTNNCVQHVMYKPGGDRTHAAEDVRHLLSLNLRFSYVAMTNDKHFSIFAFA